MKKYLRISAVVTVLALSGCGQEVAEQAAPTANDKSQLDVSQPATRSAEKKTEDSGKIQPNSIVMFPKSGPICMTLDGLKAVTLYALNGEKRKMNAMIHSSENPNGECIMASPDKRYKVFSATYSSKDIPDLGLLEIVGAESDSNKGAWAFSAGVVMAK